MKYKALFVGIDNYKHGIPALSYAENDANALWDYFMNHGYNAEGDLSILRNGTTGQILDKLEELTQTLTPEDFFLFFFAGHGYTINKQDGSFERRLAGAGDRMTRIKAGTDGISLSEIKDIADKAHCPFFVILDACQTRISSSRAVETDNNSTEGCNSRDILAISSVVNRKREDHQEIPFLVINSCGENERAYELEEVGQGLFTFSMLKALKQMEEKGVSPNFDDEFINRISEIMKKNGKGHDQHPTLIIPKGCDISKIQIFPKWHEEFVHNDAEPYPAEQLVLQFQDMRLELYSKRDVVLGRERKKSDVVVRIPKGAMKEERRKDLCTCISGRHAQLTLKRGKVVLKDLKSTNGTYIESTHGVKVEKKIIPSTGQDIKGDTGIGFSWDVTWKMRLQECAGKLQLPCCKGCDAQDVRSVILEYPGWDALYKVFVWPCCELKKVDSRLPDWRVVYKDGEQGAKGAFYLLTDDKRIINLGPGQKIVENGVEVVVEED